MTARTDVEVRFTEEEDYDAATISWHPGIVTIRLTLMLDGSQTKLIFLGPDVAALVEKMLNRLRFELAAQVTARGGS